MASTGMTFVDRAHFMGTLVGMVVHINPFLLPGIIITALKSVRFMFMLSVSVLQIIIKL